MTDTHRTLISRLGLSTTSSSALPYLRTVLSFLKEFGEEQLKQIPGVGPAVTALIELSKEEDSRKLEERIDSLLALGQETRESLALVTALAAATLFYQQRIVAQLDIEGQSISPLEVVDFAVSAALSAYRQRLALDYIYTDYRGVQGVTRQEHVASLPMEQVYVVPRLVPEAGPAAEERGREESLIRELENQDLTTAERARLEEEYAVVTGLKWRGASRGDSAPEVLSKVRHIAILGGPGVGKSTLTRFLVRACALGTDEMRSRLGWGEELTPVVLSLAGFADSRRTDPNLSLRQHLDRYILERGGEALRVALDREFKEGRVLVLLDGVDEVPDSIARVSCVRAVDLFITDHYSNRFVVTSRPFGYSRLRGDVSHYVMPNFTNSQVRMFVINWQRAFEKWLHPAAPDLVRADAEAEAMLSETQRNSRVTELATNPLILVIVCLIRQEGRRLPEKRVQLYDRAVRTLLETWNQWRSQSGIDVGGARLPVDKVNSRTGGRCRMDPPDEANRDCSSNGPAPDVNTNAYSHGA